MTSVHTRPGEEAGRNSPMMSLARCSEQRAARLWYRHRAFSDACPGEGSDKPTTVSLEECRAAVDHHGDRRPPVRNGAGM